MTATWKYKVVTLKHGGGGLKLTVTPTDDEAIGELDRKGALGWELVNAVCVGPGQPTVPYFKRSR
ncbi:MAG TPA: DUF4177 domain-containing protein [Rhodanobacter sp.]